MLELKEWNRGADKIPSVDGRQLHKFLEPGRDFSTWITTRIASFGHIEGEDFTTYLVERATGTAAREYLLALPMAAELCLLDRSERGRGLRRRILNMQSSHKCTCAGGSCGKLMLEIPLENLESSRTGVVNEWVECLIQREGNTTVRMPDSFGTIVTFQHNKYGHSVAKIENEVFRSNILKSIFYRPYIEPAQK